MPPPLAWMVLRFAAVYLWTIGLIILGFAGFDHAIWSHRDAIPAGISAAAPIVALGCLPHAVLARRKRRYREAVAAYEAAVAGATLPD